MAYKNKEDEVAYQKAHYLKNKQKYLDKAQENNSRYRTRNREYFRKYKLERGCSNCGFNGHHAALDFHHLGDKDESIARMINSAASLKTILKEVSKCVVLCANCHRIEHCS